MILIADSGSTKCDWIYIDENGTELGLYKTMGLNPYFHDEKVVSETVRSAPDLMALSAEVEHVYFYGAGASTPHLCSVIHRGLIEVFPNAKVTIDHDLVGAAFASYDGEPAITCILGTGSNSCFFDGEKVVEEVPALAYILGDEGSGSWFGKQLLREYYYKKLPADLRDAFENEFHLNKDEMVSRVYNEPHANVYLASFMKFIGKFNTHPHVTAWVKDGIRQFIQTHVHCFNNYGSVKTHFIGSIGHYFKPCLEEVCKEEGVILGEIIRKPIYGLANYHVKYLIPQLHKA
jgi:glucosamine kinase